MPSLCLSIGEMAYVPKIADAMLRWQQAEVSICKIVPEGNVFRHHSVTITKASHAMHATNFLFGHFSRSARTD